MSTKKFIVHIFYGVKINRSLGWYRNYENDDDYDDADNDEDGCDLVIGSFKTRKEAMAFAKLKRKKYAEETFGPKGWSPLAKGLKISNIFTKTTKYSIGCNNGISWTIVKVALEHKQGV